MSRLACRRPAGFCLSAIAICLAGVLAAVALAQPAAAQKRVALVIGNAAYTHAGRLANPANDAADMAAALKGVGIDVILGVDLDRRGFDAKLREFSRAIADADAGILYYAGHGLQVGLRNYLVPTDAQLQGERDLEFETVALDFVMRQMEIGREGKTNIVFLDACRDNPLARNLARAMGTRSVGVGRGLAEVQAGVGTFIAYATKPGEVALDGDGRNSPFTAALAKAVKAPGKNLTAVMVDVRKEVLTATRNRQVPWDHSALTGEFYFQLASAPAMLPKTAPPARPGRQRGHAGAHSAARGGAQAQGRPAAHLEAGGAVPAQGARAPAGGGQPPGRPHLLRPLHQVVARPEQRGPQRAGPGPLRHPAPHRRARRPAAIAARAGLQARNGARAAKEEK